MPVYRQRRGSSSISKEAVLEEIQNSGLSSTPTSDVSLQNSGIDTVQLKIISQQVCAVFTTNMGSILPHDSANVIPPVSCSLHVTVFTTPIISDLSGESFSATCSKTDKKLRKVKMLLILLTTFCHWSPLIP